MKKLVIVLALLFDASLYAYLLKVLKRYCKTTNKLCAQACVSGEEK